MNGAGHRGSSSHGEQRGRSELARRAARQARLAAPPAAPEAGARRRSHWLSLSGAAQAASLHSSTRLLPARATQLSAARPAMRGSRSAAPTTAPEAGARWPRHWLSQSGAAQAASLHFSARLLPARATQLSAARPAMRRSGSVAPPTAPASGAGWPRHWLSQSSSMAAQAALLHFSARLLPARATQLSAARLATRQAGSAALPTVPASGAGWQRHWLSQNGARGGLSRLASLLHSAAAGVGDSVTPWGVSCLRVGSVAILCPALCRVWRRSGGGTIATAGRTRGGSSRPAVLSAQSACIVKRKGSMMLALSTASGCYVIFF